MKLKAVVLSLLFALVLGFAVSTPIHGEEDFSNVEHLLKWCKLPETRSDHGFCAGYVVGVADMMQQVGRQGAGNFRSVFGMCVPKSLHTPSGNAEVQVFVNWAEKNPKEWGQVNEVGVVLALSEAWPCNETKPPS